MALDNRTTEHVSLVHKGVTLNLPSYLLTPKISSSIREGRYEAREALQLSRFIRAGDRLLEFGAGVGFISTFASKQVSLNACVVVEANPRLIPIIKQVHADNGVAAEVLHAVALSETSPLWPGAGGGLHVPFYVTPDFWASSLAPNPGASAVEQVPVVKTTDLLNRHKPTVIVCDIEGGEVDLLDGSDLSSVRSAMFEVHKSVTGLAGINKLTATMAAQGLYYDPDFSVGVIVTYSREN